jgi:subtilisin family serine protease
MTEVTSPNSPLRLSALIMAPALAGVCLVGMLWGGSNLPTTSKQLFGTVLVADLVRAATYGLALLIPFGLAVARLRDGGYRLWRGLALAFAVAGGHALLAGTVLALNRALPWPGLPSAVPALVSLLYAAVILVTGRRWFLSGHSIAPQSLLFGLSLGGLASVGWAIAGALGTPADLLLAILEALANSLLSAILIALVFYYDRETPARHPVRSGVLAAAVLAALAPSLMAVRGWSSQSVILSVAAIFSSLIAGALLVLDRPVEPRRAWWAVFAFFFMARLLPFAFTSGPEGEWIPGGLPPAASQAALLSLLAGVGLGAVLFAGRVFFARLQNRPLASGAVSLAALTLISISYAAFGRVGLQPQTFFVVMADQADTRFAQNIPDLKTRRAAVYTALTAHALTTQADLRAYLNSRGVAYTPYYLVNGLEVKGGPLSLRNELAHRPDVARILDSPHLRPQPPSHGRLQLAEERPAPTGLSWGVAYIKADQVWARWNITGKGVTIGAMGSGVDWTYPALRAQYLGSEGNHNYTWFDPWEGTTAPVDTNGIGTHTLGTALGANGIGVAPGARWIACRSLARDLGNIAYYLDCLQFLFAPFPQDGNPWTDGDPARGAHIVNAAWLCPPWEGCDATTLSGAIEQLQHAGQMVVTGAGNDGPACSSIGSPGLAQAALTVGAIDDRGTIAGFSSRGPITLDNSGRAKPDVVAPGVGIISSLPDARYAEFHGTSMASSHVAGVVALLWSANPLLIGDIERTKEILTETARHAPALASDPCGPSSNGRNDLYGFGVVDALAAVQVALGRP